MKKFFYFLGIVLSSLFFFCLSTKPKQPNVILILSDDQGYGDLGSTGNSVIETPILDTFAKQSAVFDHFYVSPLCAPTRASLLSGRYHLRTGVSSVSMGQEIMNENEYTLAEMFKDNGYKTGIFGKWHNGQHAPNDPMGQGFDTFWGFCAGHWSNYFNTALQQNTELKLTKGYITDVLTDKALEFIGKNKSKPFFCYIPYNAPHSPYQVPNKYFNKYKAKGLNNELATVYAMVDNMDENIGRILKKINDLKLEENTIIIFMTDNGPNGVRYNANMKGIKSSVNEGGIRVPCFIKWKGKIKPLVVKTRGAHIDILPTLQDLCGLKNIKSIALDGISLKKAILNKEIDNNRLIYSHVAFPGNSLKPYPAAVSNGQYKLVINEKSNELYDLTIDPYQKNNTIDTQKLEAENLANAFKNWFADATKALTLTKITKLWPTAKRIELPTYESKFNGQLKYKEGHGWAHDYLVNWVSINDSIYWEIQNPQKRSFNISINYTNNATPNGNTFSLTIGNNTIGTTLKASIPETIIPSPDKFDRKEVLEKKWSTQLIGTIQIPKGQHKIILKATNFNGNKEIAEVKSIVLRPILR